MIEPFALRAYSLPLVLPLPSVTTAPMKTPATLNVLGLIVKFGDEMKETCAPCGSVESVHAGWKQKTQTGLLLVLNWKA